MFLQINEEYYVSTNNCFLHIRPYLNSRVCIVTKLSLNPEKCSSFFPADVFHLLLCVARCLESRPLQAEQRHPSREVFQSKQRSLSIQAEKFDNQFWCTVHLGQSHVWVYKAACLACISSIKGTGVPGNISTSKFHSFQHYFLSLRRAKACL